LIFLNLTRLSNPRHSRDFLYFHHSAGDFLEKTRCVTEKAPFDGLFWGRSQAMKRKMVLDMTDDSAEKIIINHAKQLKIYSRNKFMSIFKLCQSGYCTKSLNDIKL
jgi:hypothetical protein